MTKDEALTDEKGKPMTYWGGLEQPANLKLVEDNGNGIKTYEILPINQWQELTDDEIEEFGLDLSNPAGEFVGLSDWKIFARAIEQALKEKNT